MVYIQISINLPIEKYTVRMVSEMSLVFQLSTEMNHHAIQPKKTMLLREHPFNLKGVGVGGGGWLWIFSESKYFFSLRSSAEFFFRDILSQHYYFSAKTIIFFKAQSANRIFFSVHFREI